MDLTNVQALIGAKGEAITWWQMTIRACLIFVYGLILVRIGGRRVFWKLDSSDIVVSVLVGSNLSRALTANAPFLPTLAATGALVLIYWMLGYAALYSSFLSALTKGRARPLVWNGQLDRKQMKRNGVTEGDLFEAMRSKGILDLEQVGYAYLERNGSISIIKKSE